ncbi:BTB/POZ domain-containing protein [Ditylenchus destructor]|nr:BTB/POZ domain-containing protein [Ditylenchus destructor]
MQCDRLHSEERQKSWSNAAEVGILDFRCPVTHYAHSSGAKTWANRFSTVKAISTKNQRRHPEPNEHFFRAMSGNNSTPNNSDWVRLNVGGKTFQTTKSTLSAHPRSFLASLVNGNTQCEKDDTNAFLIDRHFEHFGTILNYFRSGVVNLDRNEKAIKDLLCEADFYNVKPLSEKIQKAIDGSNSKPNSDWVRLNVGGKTFQTTKSTLSSHPESFLARLVNGDLPSDKDKSGAFLIDRSYEHFDSILNYFRNRVVNLDRNEKAMKDLLCEADFYNVQPLVNEIRKAIEAENGWKNDNAVFTSKQLHFQRSLPPLLTSSNTRKRNLTATGAVSKSNAEVKRVEIIVVHIEHPYSSIEMSEKEDDYEVLKALRQKIEIKTVNGYHSIPNLNSSKWILIESVLRTYGFLDEKRPSDKKPQGIFGIVPIDRTFNAGDRKFVRSV